MTHIEITKEFARLGLKVGDLVTVVLIDDNTVDGELSSNVHVDLDGQDNYDDSTSRIGLYPPPRNDGKIYPRMITTIYTTNIKSISRLND
jgi:hypothetical protein